MNRKSILLAGLIVFLASFGLFTTFKREMHYKNIYGNYQMIDTSRDSTSVGILHLYIGVHQDEKHFFTIYDNGGTLYGPEIPWIVGQIDKISMKQMTVTVDTELFEKFSGQYGWTLAADKLFLDYFIDDSVLTLTNTGHSLSFGLQNLAVN